MACALGWPLAADAQEKTVWLVSAESSGVHGEAAFGLIQELRSGPPTAAVNLQHLGRAALPVVPEPAPSLIVTLGVAALQAVWERVRSQAAWSRLPLLAALLPQAGFEAVVSVAPSNLSAAFLDQPIERYLDLLRLAMPDRARVGAVLGPTSSRLTAELMRAAAVRGLEPVTARIDASARSGEVYAALRTVLSGADVLLALPDSQVFNAASLQNILIAAYRQRVPMVSYSAAHVRAGATLALHTTPAQAAVQAAGMARQMLTGRGLPPPRLADDLSVTVNEAVSRSLGLAVTSTEADTLAGLLRQQEGNR